MDNETNNFNEEVQQQVSQEQIPQQPANVEIPEQKVAEPIPEPTKGSDKPKKKGKGLLISIIAVVAALVLGLGIFLGIKLFGSKKSSLANTGDGSVTTLAFYPTTEVSKKDLEKAAEVIEERVAVLGDNYEISSDDEKITLTIEKDLLGSSALERAATVEMLKSRGNIYLGNDYSAYTELKTKNIESVTVVEVNKDDFLDDYIKYFDDERFEQLDNIKADTLYLAEFTVDGDGEDVVDEQVEFFDDYDDVMALYHDVLPDNTSDCSYLGSIVFESKNDCSKFYVVSPGTTYAKFPELVAAVVEGSQLSTGYVTKIMDEPTWETDKKDFGKNQVASLDGKAIIIECTPDKYTLEYTKEVELEKFKEIIKDRMDMLDVDYMFGVKGFDNKTMCVKVSPTCMGPDFVRMIFETKRVGVHSSFDDLYSFSGLQLVEDEKIGIMTQTYSSYDEIVEQYSIPDGVVYLVVNDVTIASADLATMTEEGELVFENFLCFDNPEATEDDINMLKLICSTYDEEYVSFNGTFEVNYYDGDKLLDYDDIDWKYSCMSDEDKYVADTVKSMGHELEMTIDERNMITITMDIKVNKDLPENFLNEVKAVYAACNFDGGAYNQINFVIKDEKKESPANSFRIEFEKDTYEGKMIGSDSVSGPDFSDYWMDMYDLTEADPFMEEHSW